MRSLIAPDTLLALAADGLTVREISATLGISKKTVRTRLVRLGVKAADDRSKGATAEELQALVDEGLTLRDIARRLGRDPGGISARMRKLGVVLGAANKEASRKKQSETGRLHAARLIKARAASRSSTGRDAEMAEIVRNAQRPALPPGTVQDMEAQIAAMVAAGAVTRCPTAFCAPTRQRDPIPEDVHGLRRHVQAAEERQALKRQTWISRHYGNRGASA